MTTKQIVLDIMKYRIIFLLFASICSTGAAAQTKNEKESRVERTQFPEAAQTTINAFPKKAKRARFYRETDGEKLSFESKFKYQKHWYSVEFNEEGVLEDIEIVVKERELLEAALKNIETYFEENSEKFDIIKIQEQYIYNVNSSEVKFLESITTNRKTTTSNYEIIVAVKTKGDWLLKETTFDSNGQFINSRTLQPDSYEYIMY